MSKYNKQKEKMLLSLLSSSFAFSPLLFFFDFPLLFLLVLLLSSSPYYSFSTPLGYYLRGREVAHEQIVEQKDGDQSNKEVREHGRDEAQCHENEHDVLNQGLQAHRKLHVHVVQVL